MQYNDGLTEEEKSLQNKKEVTSRMPVQRLIFDKWSTDLLNEMREKNKSTDYQWTGFAEREYRWLLCVQHNIKKNLELKVRY